MATRFTVSAAFIPASTGWQTRNNVSRDEARDLVNSAIAKGVSQVIVYEFWLSPNGDTQDMWQFTYHTGMFKGWDRLYLPTMTYYEADLKTESKSQPYTGTCSHGLSEWLCEGPMHYPADH